MQPVSRTNKKRKPPSRQHTARATPVAADRSLFYQQKVLPHDQNGRSIFTARSIWCRKNPERRSQQICWSVWESMNSLRESMAWAAGRSSPMRWAQPLHWGTTPARSRRSTPMSLSVMRLRQGQRIRIATSTRGGKMTAQGCTTIGLGTIIRDYKGLLRRIRLGLREAALMSIHMWTRTP